MIKTGDVLQIRKPPITFSFKVLGLTENRVGAKLAPNFLENITPAEQYELLEMKKMSGFIDRERGLGRPTKKERRDLEQFTSFEDFDEGEMAEQ
jgi:ribosome-associated heat shock protein Hsp15